MPAHILVVDDDPQILHLLVRLLARENYRVSTATNGVEALARVAEQRPDLILLDVNMPEMDGFTVCQRLKDDTHTALIPITMLTGRDEPESHRRGLDAGADDFLAKPFDHSILQARIRSQLRAKNLTDQLEHTENVIFTLAMVVEEKDAYTEGHLRRLQSYSGELALAIGLEEAQVQAVRYGGLLHDIGKIGVAEAILRKPGPLTPDEMEQMRQHPVIGARLIAPMRFAPEVAPIIRSHHEWWNGSGYPDGIRGSDIPTGARIIAIVDAYDAMTTDRPYRAALSDAEALRRLREGSGTQFDPQLLEVFMDMIHHGKNRPPDTLQLQPSASPA